jgi:hypothetical protein
VFEIFKHLLTMPATTEQQLSLWRPCHQHTRARAQVEVGGFSCLSLAANHGCDCEGCVLCGAWEQSPNGEASPRGGDASGDGPGRGPEGLWDGAAVTVLLLVGAVTVSRWWPRLFLWWYGKGAWCSTVRGSA